MRTLSCWRFSSKARYFLGCLAQPWDDSIPSGESVGFIRSPPACSLFTTARWVVMQSKTSAYNRNCSVRGTIWGKISTPFSLYLSPTFQDPKDTPAKRHVETREEERIRRRKEKQELLAYKIEQGIATWAPAENLKATVDPYKTLFVSRISYETSESKLRREFSRYGEINNVKCRESSNVCNLFRSFSFMTRMESLVVMHSLSMPTNRTWVVRFWFLKIWVVLCENQLS